ncbi:hypothetical protein FISHEDRAFT_57813 [Fistulina hepatica ATCC 64428]|uniref:Uncharacterized protein n=1 Tax=Fistulina hepatica ATCC 64428 TaxID=1128425 RepID=A0A0D7AGE9_9AGAR|nr:hypothetical protein FISHEDRAFT_57813 [Fistulina hepatica ATCC 64428]
MNERRAEGKCKSSEPHAVRVTRNECCQEGTDVGAVPAITKRHVVRRKRIQWRFRKGKHKTRWDTIFLAGIRPWKQHPDGESGVRVRNLKEAKSSSHNGLRFQSSQRTKIRKGNESDRKRSINGPTGRNCEEAAAVDITMSIYRTHIVVVVAEKSLSFDMEPLSLGGVRLGTQIRAAEALNVEPPKTFQSQQKIDPLWVVAGRQSPIKFLQD